MRTLVHSPALLMNIQYRRKYFTYLVCLFELWAWDCSPVHPTVAKPLKRVESDYLNGLYRPSTLTLIRSSVSPIVRCIIKCNSLNGLIAEWDLFFSLVRTRVVSRRRFCRRCRNASSSLVNVFSLTAADIDARRRRLWTADRQTKVLRTSIDDN